MENFIDAVRREACADGKKVLFNFTLGDGMVSQAAKGEVDKAV